MTGRGLRIDVPFARLLLPGLVVLWLVPRFVAPPADPGAAARRAVEAVRGGPSPETGRLELYGLPDPDTDPADLLSRPEILAARARLQQRVAAENDALALRVEDVARRLEPTEDDLIGLRLSGWLIPFYGRHAAALQRLVDTGVERPWEALRALAGTLEGRLEEPPEGVDPEISGQRRDLTRLFRETDDALETAAKNVTEAVDTFRRDALDAAAASAGPFHRRGRGLVLEIVLAALLGATVRESLRRRATPGGTLLRLSFAPALTLGVLLPLEGSSLLPVSPLRGASLAFLPMAFGLGFATGALLRVASRLDRLFSDDAAGADREGAGSPAPPETVARRTPDTTAGTELGDHRPLAERVRELAREVMMATAESETRPEGAAAKARGDDAAPRVPPREAPPRPAGGTVTRPEGNIRTERELAEDPPVRRSLSEAAAARATGRLPFARRRG